MLITIQTKGYSLWALTCKIIRTKTFLCIWASRTGHKLLGQWIWHIPCVPVPWLGLGCVWALCGHSPHAGTRQALDGSRVTGLVCLEKKLSNEIFPLWLSNLSKTSVPFSSQRVFFAIQLCLPRHCGVCCSLKWMGQNRAPLPSHVDTAVQGEGFPHFHPSWELNWHQLPSLGWSSLSRSDFDVVFPRKALLVLLRMWQCSHPFPRQTATVKNQLFKMRWAL